MRVCGVAAGGQHSLVVSATGRLYSFGAGGDGRLGHGEHSNELAPRLVEKLEGVRVLEVAAGEHHSLALCDGKVYSFGDGRHGKLGHGDAAPQMVPRVIAGLQGVRVSSVAAAGTTSLAVTTDGEVYGWGHGVQNGRLYPVLGLELTEDQLVPLKYPGLLLRA